MIRFGKCQSIDGARVRVSIPGYSGDAVIDCLLMQPCASGPSVWIPPAVGDVVVVAYDETRPQDSVVLGVVYPDGKTPPKTGGSQFAAKYSQVYFGEPVPDTKCPRDDRVQAQLDAIRRELDAFSAAFSAHTHTIAEVSALDAVAIVEAAATMSVATTTMLTSAPVPTHTNAYVVGDTASDCVYVR